MSWYEVNDSANIPSPALLVYLSRVRENLQKMIQIAGGAERLRPHVKTHKMAEVIAMQIGAGINKFKVATFAEAEMVAETGAEDVLVAYPIVGPNVERLLQLIHAFPNTKFSTIADDEQALRTLAEKFDAANQTIDVYLEIDNGMHRTGIEPNKHGYALYQLMTELPAITAAGFHVYDGHHRQKDLQERIEAVEDALLPVYELKSSLEAAGIAVPKLICGGTPTFPVHAKQPDRECSPGTCVFWDAGYGSKFPDLPFEPAAAVLMRVISKPAPLKLCLDLGYKAIASDNPDPRVQFLQIPDAKMVGHSEEHLVIETSKADGYFVGDEIYGIPWHICPTVALYDEALIVDEGNVVGTWPVIARTRKLRCL